MEFLLLNCICIQDQEIKYRALSLSVSQLEWNIPKCEFILNLCYTYRHTQTQRLFVSLIINFVSYYTFNAWNKYSSRTVQSHFNMGIKLNVYSLWTTYKSQCMWKAMGLDSFYIPTTTYLYTLPLCIDIFAIIFSSFFFEHHAGRYFSWIWIVTISAQWLNGANVNQGSVPMLYTF